MTGFLRKIWALVKPYRLRLILGLLSGMSFALSNALLMVVVKLVPDMIFAPPGTNALTEQLAKAPRFLRDCISYLAPHLPATGSRTVLLAVIALIPLVMFLRGLFSYLNVYFMNWVAIRAVADLRVKLFAHLQNLSVGFFHKASSGDLISRLMNDSGVLLSTIGFAFSSMIKDPITVIALLALLLSQQPRLTLISMLVLPLCIVPAVIYGRRVRKSARAMQNHAAELTDMMHESFTGNRVIKAYNLEALVEERFGETTRKYVGQHLRNVRAQQTPGPLNEFFGALGVGLVFAYVAFLTETKISPGDLLQFVASIFMMYQPIKAVSNLYGQLQLARAGSERVFELLAIENSIPEPTHPKPLKAAGADIQFKDVDFAYGEKKVLQGINLTVKNGRLVALVGTSGSGKTTLTNLLLRFYDPQRGDIRIGGVDVREVTTRDLRNQIAVVAQETILFNETIRRNIELGRPGATEEEIIAAARHAHAHEFILEKPQGYDTVVGEKGVTLSGGQRQRIAIARAILRNAPILILDEATSALDTESERAVQSALEELMVGRTTVCIAHRLSTIQKADLIVVLDQGRIVEQGTHLELLQRGGVYQKLHALQFAG